LGNTECFGRSTLRVNRTLEKEILSSKGKETRAGDGILLGPTNGYWRDAIWLPCKDGTYRPTQSSIFPLVDGPSRNRVGLLRGAGNAIVAPVAIAFIEAVMEELNVET
jgi:hypothetical protein